MVELKIFMQVAGQGYLQLVEMMITVHEIVGERWLYTQHQRLALFLQTQHPETQRELRKKLSPESSSADATKEKSRNKEAQKRKARSDK